MRTLYEYMIIVECCTKPTRKMNVAPPYLRTTLKNIALSWGHVKFEDVCCTHSLWWSLIIRFLPKHMSFMWDSVGMTSTHELPTRYRQLLGMLGRSTYEKVTDPSLLLLLGLGWYHTAQRLALLQWTAKVLFGGSYRDKSMRGLLRVLS